jgi:hypothetical protein
MPPTILVVYGHMAPSYVADTVRAAFSHMGIVEKTNVLILRENASK